MDISCCRTKIFLRNCIIVHKFLESDIFRTKIYSENYIFQINNTFLAVFFLFLSSATSIFVVFFYKTSRFLFKNQHSNEKKMTAKKIISWMWSQWLYTANKKTVNIDRGPFSDDFDPLPKTFAPPVWFGAPQFFCACSNSVFMTHE